MYHIEYTRAADEDLRYFTKREQKIIRTGIKEQLLYQPTVITTNRFPREDRSDKIADWELRVGDYRVYYNVQEAVKIVRIERITEKHGQFNLFRGRKQR